MVATPTLSIALAATATLALLAASADSATAGPSSNARHVPLSIPDDEYLVKRANPADDDFVLRAGPNGEYMGGSRGAKQAKPVPMDPLPVPRTSFAPVMNVKTAFAATVPEHEGVFGKPAVMVAKCDLNTKMPTINLDNYVQITGVSCAADAVTLTFDNAATAASASAEWAKASGNWAVLVGSSWKCDGKDEIAARQVTAAPKTADGGKVVLTTKKVATEEVIATFDLKVTQHDLGEVQAAAAAAGGLVARDVSNHVSWDLNINWDKKKRKPIKPFISLLNSSNAELGADISVHGRATFSLEAKGSLFSLESYRVALEGDIAGNLDLFLRVYKEHKAELFSVEVFVLPLTPFYIPGILSMSPELRLKAAATYELAASMKLSAGLELNYPFVWSVESKTGLFGTPIAKAEGTVKVTPHPPTLSGEVSARVAAHIIPAVGVGLRIWKIPVFDLALELDSSMGMAFSAKAKAVTPIKSELAGEINVDVSHEHSLDFHIRSVVGNKAFHIWGTGKLPLPALSFKVAGSTKQIGDGKADAPKAPAKPDKTVVPIWDAIAPALPTLVPSPIPTVIPLPGTGSDGPIMRIPRKPAA
ncbi:hypothetical protein H9P43_004402 [Blastocladiella emersonii ATCC 22665]|nr:hypothetical protein H9P43_004402 [Blastocladiella emersonii ATCC 22665]